MTPLDISKINPSYKQKHVWVRLSILVSKWKTENAHNSWATWYTLIQLCIILLEITKLLSTKIIHSGTE